MFSRASRVTANWHLVKSCNYKCSFCFAHFEKEAPFLSLDVSKQVLRELVRGGVSKINFAGGEPLMHPHLHELIQTTGDLGIHASIISNASLMTKTFFSKTAPLLSQIGISCDSLSEKTNVKIGRGYGNHVEIVRRAFDRIDRLAPTCHKKLNTVVMRHNKDEDFSAFVRRHGIFRWKVFKVLRIEGENDGVYDDLSVTDDEFACFVERHRASTLIVPENNDAMTSSYLMINPEGRVYQNHKGAYSIGSPIYKTSLSQSMREAGTLDLQKYVERGGSYDL